MVLQLLQTILKIYSQTSSLQQFRDVVAIWSALASDCILGDSMCNKLGLEAPRASCKTCSLMQRPQTSYDFQQQDDGYLSELKVGVTTKSPRREVDRKVRHVRTSMLVADQ